MKAKRLTAALAALLVVLLAVAGTAAATGAFDQGRDSKEKAIAAALRDRKPRNVIFLLGDGMGTQEITAARY
ncbi:MAG: hypothetical protein ABW065_11900 [Solirubrobacterales bacterium]